jgi:5-methylcytosine-specific restriction enzyme subunit McrC
MDFLDEQRMSHLYEKFILEYFRREHEELTANASHIAWALDDGFSDMLPAMKSDVTLARRDDPGRVLIIDAKYYAHTTQRQFDKRSVHSHNLYQIFTYVKNKEAELARAGAGAGGTQPGVRADAQVGAQAGVMHEVSGMLLYARTDEDVQPDATYQMSGNKISVRTLDLGLPFADIRAQLDAIAEEHFSPCETMRTWP